MSTSSGQQACLESLEVNRAARFAVQIRQNTVFLVFGAGKVIDHQRWEQALDVVAVLKVGDRLFERLCNLWRGVAIGVARDGRWCWGFVLNSVQRGPKDGGQH